MQKSAQHSSHWYQDVQRMLPRINRNSLGWTIYRAPHLPSGSVQIFRGWDAVVPERGQGMAMCQWEEFPKEEDVRICCQSDLPFCLLDPTLHWFPPKLVRSTPAHWEVYTVPPVSLHWNPFHWWGFLWMQMKVCLESEFFWEKFSLEKHSEVLPHDQVTRSKCPVIQKLVPGKSTVQQGWFKTLQSFKPLATIPYICSLSCVVTFINTPQKMPHSRRVSTSVRELSRWMLPLTLESFEEQ